MKAYDLIMSFLFYQRSNHYLAFVVTNVLLRHANCSLVRLRNNLVELASRTCTRLNRIPNVQESATGGRDDDSSNAAG